jgi:ketosteroid isomerase-like protein
MTIKSIAKAFSNGEFENVFDFIADNAVWEVVEENTFHGKKAIIENCKQVGDYFQSVTTRFDILNVISEDNMVAVNGTAEFLREGKRISFVTACDLYEFDDQQRIQRITSYCIQVK